MPQKECGERSSITFFRFRDAFGSLFSSLFCQTPFAGLLLRQGEEEHLNFLNSCGKGLQGWYLSDPKASLKAKKTHNLARR